MTVRLPAFCRLRMQLTPHQSNSTELPMRYVPLPSTMAPPPPDSTSSSSPWYVVYR